LLGGRNNKGGASAFLHIPGPLCSRCLEHLAHKAQPSTVSQLGRCPIIGSPPSPRKVFPGRQFTGKNPPARWRIFAGKLSAGGDLSGGIL